MPLHDMLQWTALRTPLSYTRWLCSSVCIAFVSMLSASLYTLNCLLRYMHSTYLLLSVSIIQSIVLSRLLGLEEDVFLECFILCIDCFVRGCSFAFSSLTLQLLPTFHYFHALFGRVGLPSIQISLVFVNIY